MKRIYSFFMICLSLIAFCCSFTNKAITIGSIDDTTSIKNDLQQLDLTYSDYVLFDDTSENKYLDQVYLIAIGENRKNKESTDLYFYIYNPVIKDLHKNYYFNISINEYEFTCCYLEYGSWNDYAELYNEPDIYLTKVSYDYNVNVLKLKFTYENNYTDRQYSVNSIIRLTDEQTFNNKFEAFFKESEVDGKLETLFNYNSYIYITKDDIVQIKVNNYADLGSNLGILINSILGNNPWKATAMYFYNFSSSKEIDEIIEADVEFIAHRIYKHYYYNFYPFGDLIEEVIIDESFQRDYTIYSSEETEVYMYGEPHTFKPFSTPASNRLNDFNESVNLSDEQKKLFTDYEHSILFMCENYLDTRNSTGEGYTDISYVEDFKITRLKFEADGKVYNSYVSDDSDDGGTDFEDPEPNKKWWENLWEWIKKNPEKAIILGIVIIICIPLIISLLPSIISFCIKFLFWIIKLVITIIKLPFKLIGSIFTRKDEN